MMKFSWLTLIMLLPLGLIPALNRQHMHWPVDKQDDAKGHWVFFTDKDGVSFDPYDFFDHKAIVRRKSLGLCLYDTLDFPVRPDYLSAVEDIAGQGVVASRWFNAAHVHASTQKLEALEALPFVRKVRSSAMRLIPAGQPHEELSDLVIRSRDTLLFNAQMGHLQGDLFREEGFDGQGVRIAIFDAGFRGVDSHPAFRHLRKNGQIVRTWDFHRQRENVFSSSVHGTMVLSAVGGMLGDQVLGYATGAEFLLARTEIRREPLAEEQYWLAAVEWADQHGADIINSSLGYVYHRYFPEEMDGQTSLVARAAGIAAAKGVLVVNAAGNMGNNEKWHIVVTPADADSVLTVGALEHPSMLRAAYSSLGPTADGRRKPNVSALGNVLAANRRAITQASGTSFASPQVTAFAACLWQMHPSWTNMQVFRAIERSGTLFPYYDYAHGYGRPQASYFFRDPTSFVSPTFDISQHNDSLYIVLRKTIHTKGEKGAQNRGNEYLYYQVKNAAGRIEKYAVIDLEEANQMVIGKRDLPDGHILLVHFRGYTSSHSLR